jgi:hypothetical protein
MSLASFISNMNAKRTGTNLTAVFLHPPMFNKIGVSLNSYIGCKNGSIKEIRRGV